MCWTETPCFVGCFNLSLCLLSSKSPWHALRQQLLLVVIAVIVGSGGFDMLRVPMHDHLRDAGSSHTLRSWIPTCLTIMVLGLHIRDCFCR